MTTTEARQDFATARDAVRRGPVMIRDRDGDVAVLMSAKDYEKLRGQRIAAFEAICDGIGERAQALGLTDTEFDRLMSDVS